jgi:hypothetical protein
MKTNMHIHVWPYLAHFFLEREMFKTSVVEKIKTHVFMLSNLFRQSCGLCDYVEKHGTAEQATYNIMAHAHCMLDK